MVSFILTQLRRGIPLFTLALFHYGKAYREHETPELKTLLGEIFMSYLIAYKNGAESVFKPKDLAYETEYLFSLISEHLFLLEIGGASLILEALSPLFMHSFNLSDLHDCVVSLWGLCL